MRVEVEGLCADIVSQLFSASDDVAEPEDYIIDTLEDGYVVIRPILVRISRVDDATYLASFEEANIAIPGTDPQDAYQSLVAEILDTFDSLSSEPVLSGAARDQFAVLQSYVAKA
jgi:hypothetical protein